MAEHTKTIEIEIRASLAIDPRDDHVIAGWDIELLRDCVFEISESAVDVLLPGGIRATVQFINPTPFELKEAELRRG